MAWQMFFPKDARHGLADVLSKGRSPRPGRCSFQRMLATAWQMFFPKDARHGLADVPSRPRSRLMDACSGTKLATARTACAR